MLLGFPWQALNPGSIVDMVAPAGSDPMIEDFSAIVEQLQAWGLQVRIPNDLLGPDLLCANSDAMRLQHLVQALYAQDSQAVWCLRGGYGCTRLLPALFKLKTPAAPKLFIGFSDITALHIFLQQQWHWSTVHGSSLRQIAKPSFTPACRETLRRLIFAELPTITYKSLQCLNQQSQLANSIKSSIVGGNLCLIEASLGTPWQLQTTGKIILLEEVNERGYRIDRMLVHCQQAGLFDQAAAVLLGDFTGGDELNGTNLISSVLQRFAETLTIPVVQYSGIGHSNINYPIPLNTSAKLDLMQRELVVAAR